tara:strand:+ start:376 stop:621 length:246 start_codon:yes stop_codon:yes gene_type:complete
MVLENIFKHVFSCPVLVHLLIVVERVLTDNPFLYLFVEKHFGVAVDLKVNVGVAYHGSKGFELGLGTRALLTASGFIRFPR